MTTKHYRQHYTPTRQPSRLKTFLSWVALLGMVAGLGILMAA